MLKSYHLVLKNFDSQKNYGIKIRKQYGKCLSVMEKGDKTDSKLIKRDQIDLQNIYQSIYISFDIL